MFIFYTACLQTSFGGGLFQLMMSFEKQFLFKTMLMFLFKKQKKEKEKSALLFK